MAVSHHRSCDHNQHAIRGYRGVREGIAGRVLNTPATCWIVVDCFWPAEVSAKDKLRSRGGRAGFDLAISRDHKLGMR